MGLRWKNMVLTRAAIELGTSLTVDMPWSCGVAENARLVVLPVVRAAR